MQSIRIRELIITCESCGNVKKYKVTSQEDCDKLFRDFKCENNCGRSLYSFITVGTFNRSIAPLQLKLATAVE